MKLRPNHQHNPTLQVGNDEVRKLWNSMQPDLSWENGSVGDETGYKLHCRVGCREGKSIAWVDNRVLSKITWDEMTRFLAAKYMLPHIESWEHKQNKIMQKLAGPTKNQIGYARGY